MENKFLESVSRSFSVELPFAESLDRYLDQLIPVVRPLGEDLWESKFYVNKAWLEFKDDENFHDTVVHFFNEGEEDNEYLRSINGNVKAGTWRYLDKAGKFLVTNPDGDTELFDLAFLDTQFFILKKHGDQERMGERKYFMMVNEKVGRRLEWRDAMELLFNKYRNNNSFYLSVVIIIVLIAAIVLVLSL
ncbi:MAG: hypothetical protein AAF798_07245 [Bacteroidota bacterium]